MKRAGAIITWWCFLRVSVRFYAILRDLYGADNDQVEISEGSTVRDLLAFLSKRNDRLGSFLEKRLSSIIALVNGLYAPLEHRLHDGDTVDLLPPASGGCNGHGIVSKGSMPNIESMLEDARKHAEEEGLGALLIYIGIVKSPIDGERVNNLYYEVHREYTMKRFSEISEEIRRRYGVNYIKIYHAEGNLKPGDPAMIIAIQSRGRKEAIEAMRETIEMVKHTTGIWKLESRENGQYWVLGDGERISREETKSTRSK